MGILALSLPLLLLLLAQRAASHPLWPAPAPLAAPAVRVDDLLLPSADSFETSPEASEISLWPDTYGRDPVPSTFPSEPTSASATYATPTPLRAMSSSPSPSASLLLPSVGPSVAPAPPSSRPSASASAAGATPSIGAQQNAASPLPPSPSTAPLQAEQNEGPIPEDVQGPAQPPCVPGGQSQGLECVPGLGPDSTVQDGQRTSCFPASAMVRVRGRTGVAEKRMEDVRVGDSVADGMGGWDEVFMWTHRDARVWAQFVTLRVSGKELKVTGGHLVYTRSGPKKAREVRVGEAMPLDSGEWAEVEVVASAVERGLFNAQTISGDLVVEGVRVSAYTEAVGTSGGHALLAPLRAAYTVWKGGLARGAWKGVGKQ